MSHPTLNSASLRQALLELLKVVADHPDAMFDGTPLNAAFIKATKALQDFDGPPPELTGDVLHGSIIIE